MVKTEPVQNKTNKLQKCGPRGIKAAFKSTIEQVKNYKQFIQKEKKKYKHQWTHECLLETAPSVWKARERAEGGTCDSVVWGVRFNNEQQKA